MESKKAAFMGKIVAGVTHEIKNVLAIIKESAGLMDDLISLSKENSLAHRDKFIRSLSRIDDQVARGVDLSTQLNAFAHAPDEAISSLNLNDTVVQAAFLCARFARLRGLTLEARPSGKALIVVTDPLGLQMLLFTCIDLMMSVAPSGASITLSPSDGDGKQVALGVAVQGVGAGTEIAGECNPVDSPGWPIALEIAQGLGVALEATGPPPRVAIRFP